MGDPAIGLLAVIGLLANNRHSAALWIPVAPDLGRSGHAAAASGRLLFLAWFANQQFWPKGLADPYAASHGLTPPLADCDTDRLPLSGPAAHWCDPGHDVAWPTAASFGPQRLRIRRKPGRCHAGRINTRWTIMKTYMHGRPMRAGRGHCRRPLEWLDARHRRQL